MTQDFSSLRKMLCYLFDTHERARLLAKDTGLDAAGIAFSPILDVYWDNILMEAMKHGRLRMLLEKVSDEFPNYRDKLTLKPLLEETDRPLASGAATTHTEPPTWSTSTPSPLYDIFISYSHMEESWVHSWLVPKLEAAELRVCTDRTSFDAGVPSLVNIERAVATSRHTALILTNNWVESQWTNYEALLTQTSDPTNLLRRTIPILRKPCAPPPRIAMLTYVDLRESLHDPARIEAEFHKLVDATNDVRRLPDVMPTDRTLSSAWEQQKEPIAHRVLRLIARYTTCSRQRILTELQVSEDELQETLSELLEADYIRGTVAVTNGSFIITRAGRERVRGYSTV